MKKYSRIVFLIAVLAPLLLFVFPMWRITLTAPQYPDGVTMYIWISKITGATESTLQNINILNHYIGMQYIEPDNIAELKYFPFVVVGMVALGLVFWFTKKRKLYLTWAITLAILGGLGIYDFYLWEYDYGHNLDPHAPIQIPGATYQPPLIGTSWLLNFKADSWPHVGGIALGVSIALGFASFFMEKREKRRFPADGKKSGFSTGRTPAAAFTALALLILASCSVDKTPIHYGVDQCDHCMMKIVQGQYGAEIVTSTGKAFKFDAIECLIGFKQEGKIDPAKIHGEYVVAFDDPKNLRQADQCGYLRSPQLPSPMGMFLTALTSGEAAEQFQRQYGGETFLWEELNQSFNQLPAVHAH